MKTAFIGSGSNLGKREQQLSDALVWIADEIGEVVNSSSIYQTSPWGDIEQPDYLNQVWEIRTQLNPFQLMKALLHLEKRAKRERIEKWGARTLDLDLLFYEDYYVQTELLTLPHPYLHLRNFVLVPLAEIAPDWIHPVFGKTIALLTEECEDEEKVIQWFDGPMV